MINKGLARVQIIGNLVDVPELKMAGETPKAKMRVAVNESWTKDGEKQEYTSYFTVIAWGGRGKACADYLVKGQQVVVVGTLRQERFEDNDGNKVAYVTIVADDVIFGDKPKSATATEGNAANAVTETAEPATDELPF